MADLIVIIDDAVRDLSAQALPDITADYVAISQASDSTPKKVLLQNLVGTVLAALRSAFTAASSSAPASLAFAEDTDNGSNKITVTAPASIASDKTVTLPDETCDLGFRNIPQNPQSDNYTCVLGDSGKHIYETGASKTVTIPANASVAYAVGTSITFVATDAGGCSIAITSDTLRWSEDGTTGTRTLAQYGIATAIKVTSTEWLISGTGLS